MEVQSGEQTRPAFSSLLARFFSLDAVARALGAHARQPIRLARVGEDFLARGGKLTWHS
jgi:hypothetical protein